MDSKNIKIGIDLGTTNSEVCISNKGNLEIIKNRFGNEFTPSVLWIDKSLNKQIGQKAYENFFNLLEQQNVKSEIKRLMGTNEKVKFPRLDKEMTPEEISAEILISLKEDIKRKYNDFDLNYAVITVPAYFSILQSEATKRAGEIAGFKHVVLLQEPIAAAVAYGFMNSTNETWVVYDLGGGTFDVALVNSKDGLLSVIAHNGDNFLGGKDFDAEIVYQKVIPELKEQFNLENLSIEDEEFKKIFNILKYRAEQAKKELTSYEETSIDIDNIGEDEDGVEINTTIKLTKKEFENIIRDKVSKTIELTKETIKSSGIDQNMIKKVILVGGPTQIPYIRERIAKELKIEVDTSLDPLSAVAKGACIYAMSQNVPDTVFDKNKKQLMEGEMSLKLEYRSLSSEIEENIYGLLENIEQDKEYFVQIQSDSNHFSSPKTKINNGKFFKEVNLEKNKTNIFYIYIFDEKGNIIKTSPDSFSITQGLSIAGAPISHSIGIVVADRNESLGEKEFRDTYLVVFEKGSILPLKDTRTFKTVKKLVKNEKNATLDIVVGEGESKIPDRNTFICTLGINGQELPYDLPSGTEVEITIEVNESREVSVAAYFPLIDKKYNGRSSLLSREVDLEKIEEELETESMRIDDISKNISENASDELREKLRSVYHTVRGATSGVEEKEKADKELRELKVSIDELQEKSEMPKLTNLFSELVKDSKEFIETYASEEKKDIFTKKLTHLETDGNEAIKNKDKRKINQVIELLEDLKGEIIYSNDATWIYQFRKLSTEVLNYTNYSDAQYYIKKGNDALIKNDVEEIKRCVRNLLQLLERPETFEGSDRNTISGIRK